MKRMTRITILTALGCSAAIAALPAPSASPLRDRPSTPGVIFVRSQGLYYDTFNTADPVPPRGRFQRLEMGPNGVETDFGPGDVGYLGGRWVEDLDGDGVEHYFVCPLLPPGRETP